MADIDFTTSLNDKGFTVGLKNVEKQAAKAAKNVESMFKMEILTKLGQGLGRLVTGAFQALAKQSADAAAALRELEQIQQAVMAAIGQELLPLLQQALAGLKAVGSTVGDVWRSAIDSVAVGMRMLGGEEYQEALENVQSLRDSAGVNSELDRRIAALRAARQQRGGGPGAGPAIGNGDTTSLMADAQKDIDSTLSEQAQTMLKLGQIEQQRLDRHAELDKRMAGLTEQARKANGEAEARALIDRAADALAQQVGASVAKEAAERVKAADAAAAAQVIAVRAVMTEEKRMEIENMRLAGLSRQAALADRLLDRQERLWALEENSLLNDQERLRARGRLLQIFKDEDRLRDEADRRELERRMGFGGLGQSLGGEALANAGLADQVFGPPVVRADSGQAAQAAAATARNTARTADLLQQAVDRGTFGTRGAVFA